MCTAAKGYGVMRAVAGKDSIAEHRMKDTGSTEIGSWETILPRGEKIVH